MSLQPTQRHRKAAEYRDAVGRCCQRHTVTGRVITDWYPTGMNGSFVHNRCCQRVSHSLIRGMVHRRTRRQTRYRASDNSPVQSGQLCAGSAEVDDNYNCKLRFTLGTAHFIQRPEKRALGPRERDGRIGACVGSFGDWNVFDRCGAVSEHARSVRSAAARPRGGASA